MAKLSRISWLCAAACWFLIADSAWAHQLNVFATVEGTTIRGEAYYRGGAAARQAKVDVLDSSGASLGQVITDDQGHFAFQAQLRTDHRLVVDGGQGHASEFRIPASELPATLPAAPPAAPGSEKRPAPPATGLSAASPSATTPAAGPSTVDLGPLQTQIGQLRRELDELKHQTQFRDVLGGIGYILGLASIAFYFLGVRRQPSSAACSRQEPREV